MFLSYEFIKYLGHDDKTDEFRYQYKIIDSEFEEVAGAVAVAVVGTGRGEGGSGFRVGVGVGVAVIDTYEKRGLNVAANLMKAFVWYNKKSGYSVNDLITWNRKYNKKFSKYEKELEKYVVLL